MIVEEEVRSDLKEEEAWGSLLCFLSVLQPLILRLDDRKVASKRLSVRPSFNAILGKNPDLAVLSVAKGV